MKREFIFPAFTFILYPSSVLKARLEALKQLVKGRPYRKTPIEPIQ
jgi:hypothetical protein